MKNRTENSNYNEIFREKMDQLDFPYDNSQWVRLEKELDSSGISSMPGNSKSTFKIIGIIATGIAVILISGIIYFTNDANSNSTNQDITVVDNTPKTADIETNTINSTDNINTQTQIISITKGEISPNISQENKILKSDILESNTDDKIADPIVNKDYTLETQINTEAAKIQPDARFLTTSMKGCAPLKVSFNPIILADSIEYTWDFGDGEFSNEKNPVHVYKTDGIFIVSLNVKFPNSGLASFYNMPEEINVYPVPKATISTQSDINTYSFKLSNTNENTITWSLNKVFLSENNEIDYTFKKSGVYNLSCIVENEFSCKLLLTENLDIRIDHNIPMPTAFSPDGNGSNDLFGPGNEYFQHYKLDFQIYNKAGDLVFKNTGNNIKWDGVIAGSGNIAPNGVYVYILQSKDEYGNLCVKKGSITLIR